MVAMAFSSNGCQKKETTNPTLFQKAPADWRAETIPFPLAFAPDIDLKGVAELRFAPGMFEPDRETFFTYAFVWWLEGEPQLNQAQLEQILLRYFSGLYQAVSKKEVKDTSSFAVSLTEEPEAEGMRHFSGTATWIDPFATEEPLTLNIKIAQWPCPNQQRTMVYSTLSPTPRDHVVWQQFDQIVVADCDR